jgi:hypothetical protein
MGFEYDDYYPYEDVIQAIYSLTDGDIPRLYTDSQLQRIAREYGILASLYKLNELNINDVKLLLRIEIQRILEED